MGASGLLADISEDTAVDIEDMTVDEIAGLGGEEHSRTLEIFGSAPACGRSLRDDEAVERMTASVGLISRRGAVCSVAIYPGPMPLHCMLCSPYSEQMLRVSILRPPFAAA